MKDTILEKNNKYECDMNVILLINIECVSIKKKYYFDSYGKLIDKPIKELGKYLGKGNIFYIEIKYILDYNDSPICCQLCIYVLN